MRVTTAIQSTLRQITTALKVTPQPSVQAGRANTRHITSTHQPDVFDRGVKLRQRDQSLVTDESDYYDYLREEVASHLVDRLDDITRRFPTVLEVGCHRGHFLKKLIAESEDREEVCGGIESLMQIDSSPNAIAQASVNACRQSRVAVQSQIQDDAMLNIPDNSYDLVISSLVMHWVNDVPGTLGRIHKALRPDGCFLGAMLGGNTLKEFRYCMYLAEQERKGGISPHTSPFAGASDISSLLQAAGFQLQTVDVDNVQIGYPDMFSLMEHLQRMGEGNASLNRQFAVGRDTFLAAAALYQKLYGLDDGSVPATFQVMYMIGWKHHDSQPKPKARGSHSKPIPGKRVSEN